MLQNWAIYFIMDIINKNILLLGGNGFLGRNLAVELNKREKFKVSVFDMTEPCHAYDGINYYAGNLNETGKIIDIIQKEHINVLVHMVSTIIPGSPVDNYISNCEIVQINTIPLLDYCAKNNVEFVFFSSGGTVYGVKGGTIREDEPTAPISYYGLSKVQIEDLINFYHRRYNLNYIILRPSNPYGHGQNLYGKQGLIAVIMGKLLKNEPVTVFGDGETIRDYIYIDDFVYYVASLIHKGVLNETINVGSGEGYSINQIVSFVNKMSSDKLKVEYIDARKDDVPKMILDTTRLHNFIDHKNKTMEEGIMLFYNGVMNKNK